MNILGISAFYHDSAACLVQEGKIIAAAQEERFSRKKHDLSFPKAAINYCLRNSGLNGADLNFVVFYDKPFIKLERILHTYLSVAPAGVRSFIKAMPLWIKQKLWIKDLIRQELNFTGKIIFPQHHQSHAASAFFPSPFQESVFLTIDGVGEWTTASYGLGKDNEIKVLSEMHFPHSLGLLYSAFTYYIGFKVNSGEYKVMGLAPYGKAKYRDLILTELLDLKEDGSFKLNMKYFGYCSGLKMTNRRFERLFGAPARKPNFRLTQRDMDLARSIQEVTEEVMLRMVRYVYQQTKQKNLCLAGGVALNCVGNGRILREGPFENVWIQPAAGDAGGALGAALFCWYQYLGNKRISDNKNNSQQGFSLGPSFDNGYILEYLQRNNISYQELSDEEVPGKIADLIDGQKVIGWFQGRMEFGPRALGNRSIIGDARSVKMRQRINREVKFREDFRPFAPSVLLERASDFFELNRPSPYMLLVAPVKKEIRRKISEQEEGLLGLDRLKVVRSSIPAVTHVDYSARIQTVDKDDNPLYYRLLEKFEQKYNCPIIINTSFNVRDEPIVCTPEDAYSCFMRTNMDYLIMGNFLLEKKQQQVQPPEIKMATGPSKRQLRQFGIVSGIGLALVGGLLFLRGRDYHSYFFVFSGTLLFFAFTLPALLAPIQKLWMGIAFLIGGLITRLISIVLFYLVVTPIAILAKIFHKGSLDIKLSRNAPSYWLSRKVGRLDQRDYEQQF